jgi:hypothetical protein
MCSAQQSKVQWLKTFSLLDFRLHDASLSTDWMLFHLGKPAMVLCTVAILAASMTI